MTKPIREQVLNWTNLIRADLGLEPLTALRPGVCTDASHCVIAESIVIGSDYGIEVIPSDDSDFETGTVIVTSQRPGDKSILTLHRNTDASFFDDDEFEVYEAFIPMPRHVNDFAVRFDNRRYPDLIDSRGAN